MTARKTNFQFINDLQKVTTTIVPLSDYSDAKSPIRVKCLTDGHEWEARPYNLLAGKGCPKCAGCVKKTQEEFESMLFSNTVTILSKYDGMDRPVLAKCLLDGHEWTTPARSLVASGCPKCAGNLNKTTADFSKEITDMHNSVEMLGSYKNAHTNILFRCLVDGYEWLAKPHDILYSAAGCPKCAGNMRVTHEEFVDRLSAVTSKIAVIGQYISFSKKIRVKCSLDGHEWLSLPGNLLNGQGCPICSKSGYKVTKHSTLYVYKFRDAYGFGITNNFKNRHYIHKLNFNKLGIAPTLVKTYEGDGVEILSLETHLKSTLPIYDTVVLSFRTEAVREEDGILLFREIDKYLKKLVGANSIISC